MTEIGEPNEGRKVAIECLYFSLSVLIGLILGVGSYEITIGKIICPGKCEIEAAMMGAFLMIIGGIAGASLASIGGALARITSKLPWWVGAIIGGLIPVIAFSILSTFWVVPL